MDKYIKLEDLKDYLNRQVQAFEPCPDKYDAAVGIYNGLYKIPVADVAPIRHGKWHDVYMTSSSSFAATCSVCGISNDIPHPISAYYCPNCGAKMDKDSDRE